MILDDELLLKILEENPNKKLIEVGRERRKTAQLHMHGVGLDEHLTLIEGFEKPFVRELRVKYAQSNKDLFARLSKPVDKVFTARGGITYYNMDKEAAARDLEENVINGLTCKQWIEQYWKVHMLDDPMGFIFIEVDKDMRPYPTYKSVGNVYDYSINGHSLDYVIWKLDSSQKKALNLENEEVIFRVVDDVADNLVRLKDKQIEVLEQHSFPNYFLQVPAIMNGFIPCPDGMGFVSLFDPVFPLADSHLVQMSVKITHMFLHGFPKYWEFADDCIECQGSGKVNGKTHSECKGTGKKIMTRVSDVKLLEYPDKETPSPAPNVAGYVEPSKIFWDISRYELAELEQKMTQTVWGSKSTTKLQKGMGLSAAPNGTVTATEVMDNRQPEVESLHPISNAAEKRHKFIMDMLIQVKINPSYVQSGGCSCNYGRRFLIEEPDALLNRYVEARKNGISPTVLSGMYEQYLESRYQSDNISLSLHKKLMKVEPFLHYTLPELKQAGATPEDIRKKQYYSEWLNTQNADFLIISSTSALLSSFERFCSSKPLPVELDNSTNL